MFKDSIMSLWTITTTIVYTVFLGIPAIFIALFSKTGKAPFKMARPWAWLIMKTNRVKLVVEGLENIAKNNSYVFISNHSSNLDPLAVARAIPQTLRFVGKKSLAKIPIFGWACRLGKIIFIDRADSQAAVETINKTAKDLKDGISAYFFAEGTRSKDGHLQAFKKGGIVFAMRAKLPIVPITILGSHSLLPKNAFRIRPGIMKIIVGDPIDTSSYSENDKESVLQQVRSIISSNIEQYGEARQS